MSNILKMRKGTETLMIASQKMNNDGLLRYTIEKRDAKNSVISRNFMNGRSADMFNLRCQASMQGWIVEG